MSFSRMKPLPKILIIGSSVAALVYGLSFIKLPEKKAVAAPVEVTTVPSEASASATPAVAATSAPAPVAEVPTPSTLKPAGGSDAGLDAVLKAGQK